MAWIELTNYDDSKFFANTDHFCSVEDYFSGGAPIKLMKGSNFGDDRQHIKVRETKNKIKILTTKADLSAAEHRRIPVPRGEV